MTQKYIQADFELWLSKFCKKKVPQNPPRLLSVCLLYNSESLCKAVIERHRRRLLLSQSSCNVFYGTWNSHRGLKFLYIVDKYL